MYWLHHRQPVVLLDPTAFPPEHRVHLGRPPDLARRSLRATRLRPRPRRTPTDRVPGARARRRSPRPAVRAASDCPPGTDGDRSTAVKLQPVLAVTDGVVTVGRVDPTPATGNVSVTITDTLGRTLSSTQGFNDDSPGTDDGDAHRLAPDHGAGPGRPARVCRPDHRLHGRHRPDAGPPTSRSPAKRSGRTSA